MSASDSLAIKTGRPRSPGVHHVIVDGVLDLIGGGATLTSLSLVDVARRTGISRNSIYRRWHSKDELFSDVVKSMTRPLPDLTKQSARENLVTLMDVSFDRVTDQRERRMAETIVAEAQNFPDLHEQYLAEIVAPLNHAMKLAIRRGKEIGEIRPDIDENLLCDVLVSCTFAQSSTNFTEGLDLESANRRKIDLVFDGVSPM